MAAYKIQCVVDNCVALSSPFWGEHGLAFLVQAQDQSVLFDTGQSGTVLAHNLQAWGESGDQVVAIALSHGHNDHVGGLRAAIEWAPQARILAHPGVFVERFSRREQGGEVQLKPIGFPHDVAEMRQLAQWDLDGAPRQILPGVWLTGEVPRAVDAGMAEPRHVLFVDGVMQQDGFEDDQAIVIETERGLVVVLGCCHAGLRNTLAHVRTLFPDVPIHALLGGSHLNNADSAQLEQIITDLKAAYAVERLYLNHCTGQALDALRAALGERVKPCRVGTSLIF